MENRMNERFNKETGAGRSLLLWLLGIPIPIILIIWLMTGHC
jgi:hypothetical protein